MKNTKVSIIMASSLDGKITLPNCEKVRFTSDEDKRFLIKMRSEYDCVIIGALTVKKGCSPVISNLIKDKNQPLNVLVSTDLNLDFRRLKYFKNNNIKRIIFTTNKAPIKKSNELQKTSDLFIVKKDKDGLVDVKEVYDIITKEYKCKRILIEGGGLLNKSFLEKNIVDDIYLTICPILMADTTSRSFVEGTGLAKENVKKLRLLSCRKDKSGEIFLHYQVQKNIKPKWKKKGHSWRLIN